MASTNQLIDQTGEAQRAARLAKLEARHFQLAHFEGADFDLGSEAWSRRPRQCFEAVATEAETHVRQLFGHHHVVLTVSGRSAAALLLEAWRGSDRQVPQNHLSVALRYHQLDQGFTPCCLSRARERAGVLTLPFSPELDLETLAERLHHHASRYAFVWLEPAGPRHGGQPLKLAFLRQLRALLQPYGLPLVLEMDYLLDNVLIQTDEDAWIQVWQEIRALSAHADVLCGGLAGNYGTDRGGLIACRDEHLAHAIRHLAKLNGTELHQADRGRVLAGIAQPQALIALARQRLQATARLAQDLRAQGVPLLEDTPGSMLLLDTRRLPAAHGHARPGLALAVALLVETGVLSEAFDPGPDPQSSLADYLPLCLPLGLTAAEIEELSRRLGRFFLKLQSLPMLLPTTQDDTQGKRVSRYRLVGAFPQLSQRSGQENAANLETSTAVGELFLLSAANEPQLRRRAEQLASFCADRADASLAALARASRRDQHLAERLAIRIEDREGLIQALQAFAQGHQTASWVRANIAEGQAQRALFEESESGQAFMHHALRTRDLTTLAWLWCYGLRPDWTKLEHPDTEALALPAHWPTTSPEPCSLETTPDSRRATSPWLTALTAVVAEFLKLDPDQLEPDEHLTTYGLTSYTGLRLANRLRDHFGLEITPPTLFRHGSLLALASHCAGLAPLPTMASCPCSASLTVIEALPLTEGQLALYYLQLQHPTSTAYNVPFAVRLRQSLVHERLASCIANLTVRHAALRARVAQRDGALALVLAPSLPLALTRVDARGLSDQALLTKLAATDSQPFDLHRGPLVRASLVSRAEDDHVLLLTFHHLVFDGDSAHVLLAGLIADYQGQACLPEPNREAFVLQAFGQWQRDLLVGSEGATHARFWQDRLARPLPTLALAGDRGPAETSRGALLVRALPAPWLEQVTGLAMRQTSSLFAVALAGFKLLLHQWSGQRDLIVGVPFAGRSRSHFEDAVGYFVNILPIRTRIQPGACFLDLLAQVHSEGLQALEHGDYPFARMVRQFDTERDGAQAPVFEACFNLLNWSAPTDDTCLLRPEPLFEIQQSGEFALTLEIITGSRPTLVLSYDAQRFADTLMNQVLEHYLGLLEQVAAAPSTPLEVYGRHQAFAPSVDAHALLELWNRTEIAVPATGVWQLIAERALRQPSATALEHGQCMLDFATLYRRMRGCAQYLRGQGLGPEQPVVLGMSRGPEAVIAFLALLELGALIALIDLSLPADRLAFQLADCGDPVVLADSASWTTLPPALRANAVLYEDLPVEERPWPPAHPPELAAYLIYTSGSTGRPKGTVIAQGALRNKIATLGAYLELDVYRGGLLAPLAFDPFVEQMLMPLYHGGTLVILPLVTEQAPASFWRELEARRLDLLDMVPSILAQLLPLAPAGLPPLRHLILGGEALPWRLFNQLRELPWVGAIHNFYGPTEATIDAVACRLPGQPLTEPPPIGRPLANYRAYVLDPSMRPVVPGETGQLFLAGMGLARGYWRRPALTAASFLPDPLSPLPGGRRYATGDLACWRDDGQLLFMGRGDQQFKLRGVRIEPEEVEHCLAERVPLTEVAVQPCPSGETPRLAAFLVLAPETSFRPDELADQLAQVLPAAMIPSQWLVLPTLPKSPSGKLDRQALVELAERQLAATELAPVSEPRTELELELHQLWSRLLERNPAGFGTQCNFFTLGGHSLLALRMLAELDQLGKGAVELAGFLRRPTIAGLAALIDGEKRRSDYPWLVPLQSEGSKPPLYLIHPIGGSITCYLPLAQVLAKGRPCFGIQSPALEHEAVSDFDLAALASRYLEAVRAHQPDGPYLLGGWSIGGLIALEMAHQLARLGQSSQTLLIDTNQLRGSATHDLSAMATAFAEDLLYQAGQDPRILRELSPAAEDGSLLTAFLELVERQRLLPLSRQALAQRFALYCAHLRAAERYLPPRHDQPVIYLQAQESPRQPWSAFLTDLRSEVVPGNHYTLFQHADQWMAPARWLT